MLHVRQAIDGQDGLEAVTAGSPEFWSGEHPIGIASALGCSQATRVARGVTTSCGELGMCPVRTSLGAQYETGLHNHRHDNVDLSCHKHSSRWAAGWGRNCGARRTLGYSPDQLVYPLVHGA